jgi:hypothetical protein
MVPRTEAKDRGNSNPDGLGELEVDEEHGDTVEGKGEERNDGEDDDGAEGIGEGENDDAIDEFGVADASATKDLA